MDGNSEQLQVINLKQLPIDWVYGNMRPDSTYVWLHCHKEESK